MAKHETSTFADTQRVAELHRLLLLGVDAGSEPFFEDLIDLVQSVCSTPIAVVSLSDLRRQWFKAKRGIDAQEVPRKESFCAHVVEVGAPLVVNDAFSHPTFRNNALVTGPSCIRAYAGAPIIAANGQAIGTVCALDQIPRNWGSLEVAHLQRAARMIVNYAEARAAFGEMSARTSRAEERETATDRQREIISAMNEGVVVHAADGSIIECNRAACDILGLSEDQLRGLTSLDPRWQALDESGSPLAGENHPAMRALTNGERIMRVNMTVMRSEHDRRHLLVSATPLSADKVTGERPVVATFVDITEQIAQQRQLSELLGRAEQESRAKSEFLAAMSHEIRTPLNGLLGVAQHLTRNVSDPYLVASVELLRSSGLALKDIVDDALDIDRIEAGVLRLHEATFYPAQIIGEVAAIYQAPAEAKGIELSVSSEIASTFSATGDAGRIRQIALNLVSNAVKFTDFGHVRLKLQLLEQSQTDGTVYIEVADTGRGIASEFSDTLFAKFSRGPEAQDDTAGAGLGLYLSLKLARLMGGDLQYRPNTPIGSIFHAEIPVRLQTEAKAPARTSDLIPPGRLRVLIAEDHHVNREIFSLLMEPFDMSATFASDGQEALQAAKTGVFDLILMDRQMPGLDGVEATRQLREWEKANGGVRTPVIFVSANGSLAAMSEATAAGADGYITKPVIVEQLAAAISKTLQGPADGAAD